MSDAAHPSAIRRSWLLVMLCLAGASSPQTAAAQACCRLTTDRTAGLECSANPSALNLFWERSCLRYGFGRGTLAALTANSQRAAIPDEEKLNARRIREVFDRAFGAWLSADCGGGELSDFYVEQLPGELDITEAAFDFGVRNEMVVLAHPGDVWEDELGHIRDAFAVTSVWYDPKSGLIYDADIEINLGRGPYADCETPCLGRTPFGVVDLGNTITHEVGHVFGLAHSTVEDSTMFARTLPGQIHMRELLPSDEACFCSTYPPGSLPANACAASGDPGCRCQPPPIYEPRRRPGCSCSVPGAQGTAPRHVSGWAWAAGLLSAALTLRGRRRRRSRLG